jgi:hypothetical protein
VRQMSRVGQVGESEQGWTMDSWRSRSIGGGGLNMSSHQRMGAVTPKVMKDAGGSVAVQRLSQAAVVAKVNLVGARDKRSAHDDDGLDGDCVHVHVECEHGFVLISGLPDETLQPMCYRGGNRSLIIKAQPAGRLHYQAPAQS